MSSNHYIIILDIKYYHFSKELIKHDDMTKVADLVFL